MGTLFYGDNLDVMTQKLKKESVDLIYLDPPFNSKRNYNMMYKTMTGYPVSEQEEAFCDTWTLDAEKEEKIRTIELLMKDYGVDEDYVSFWGIWIKALRHTQPSLLAYLVYMVERLLHMKVLLKPTGSIYLHCDPTASHYIKVMMDGIFGHKNFRNEIIWHYRRWTAGTKNFQRMHDVILRYTKTDNFFFNLQYEPYGDWIKKDYKYLDEETGKRWRWHTVKGTRYKVYLEDENRSVKLNDVWTIPQLASTSKERLGYPTQKPIALLDRIIKASCPPDGVVFDPFCGCGTTIYSAIQNQRKWIGCDIAILPIKLIKHQLEEKYRLSEDIHFKIDGIPVSVEQAQILKEAYPYQFQHWIVEHIGGFPTLKKSADKGVDGRIYIDTRDGLKEMILSVKSGVITPSDIRDLRGTLEREYKKAVLAGFISLQDTTRGMREEAALAGLWEYQGMNYERIQLLTVQEILEDKKLFHTPTKIGIRGKTGQLNLPLFA